MASKKQRVDAKNATIVKRSDYTRTLNAIIRGGFCPFCEEHLFKHHRRPLLDKTRHWLVTENAWPYTGSQFHLLLVTRIHIETIEEMSPAVWTDLHKQYQSLVKKYRIKGAALMIRSGDTRFTGASVNHLHAHLVVGTQRTKSAKPIKALIGFKK